MKHPPDPHARNGKEGWRAGGFGLYVHWPFCASKCPYCDFNSHVAREIDESRWRQAYLHEIRRLGDLTEGRVLSSIFFGGGTPSLMSPGLAGDIVEAARATWRCANTLEVTLEANPSSVEAGRFRAFAGAGINRVSVGVQALDDASLRRLGRLHSAEDARRALEIAFSVFDRVSFDLIYARQHQTLADWRTELEEALRFGPRHLSLYQLTIEDGTPFGALHQAGKLRGLPDDGLSADLYLETQEICARAGLPAYEVSNHAGDGQACRHNLIYWRGGDFAAVGPGAHGRLSLDGSRFATVAVRQPEAWLKAVFAQGHGDAQIETISPEEATREYLMMGLRLTEGVDLDCLEEMGGGLPEAQATEALVEEGFLWLDRRRLGATESGRLLLNAVLRRLL